MIKTKKLNRAKSNNSGLASQPKFELIRCRVWGEQLRNSAGLNKLIKHISLFELDLDNKLSWVSYRPAWLVYSPWFNFLRGPFLLMIIRWSDSKRSLSASFCCSKHALPYIGDCVILAQIIPKLVSLIINFNGFLICFSRY